MVRLQRLKRQLEAAYEHLIIALPPATDLTPLEPVRMWSNASLIVSPKQFWGRYVAVKTCLERPVSHVHYADLDMLIRWVEDRPDEWRETVARIQTVDCLITGRTDRAFRTRPQAIQQTEGIINSVGSYLLGQPVDLGLGSRGFSRRAAGFVILNSRPGGFGDLEWPILVQRAGIQVQFVTVDGVDWESADQYRQEAADPETRRLFAERYDQIPRNWARRVQTAQEIIVEGIAAMQRSLVVSG